MKIYEKSVHVFEFSKEEIKMLDIILSKVNTTDLNCEEDDFLTNITDELDNILHP